MKETVGSHYVSIDDSMTMDVTVHVHENLKLGNLWESHVALERSPVVFLHTLRIQVPPKKILYPPRFYPPKCIPSTGSLDP